MRCTVLYTSSIEEIACVILYHIIYIMSRILKNIFLIFINNFLILMSDLMISLKTGYSFDFSKVQILKCVKVI